MAAGKQDSRQKMINMMYLVFIAMLALNISKEVLATLGILNDEIENSIRSKSEKSKELYGLFKQNAENPSYSFAKEWAPIIEDATNEYYSFIQGIKDTLLLDKDGKNKYKKDVVIKDGPNKSDTLRITNYQTMDKSLDLDDMFFEGNNYDSLGVVFVDKFKSYSSLMRSIIDSIALQESRLTVKRTPHDFSISKDLLSRSFTFQDSVVNSEGTIQPYLDYNYKGFPKIASLSKLTKLQSDVRELELQMVDAFNTKILSDGSAVNINTSKSLLNAKSTYFVGERINDAKILIGRIASDFQPDSVSIKIDNRQLRQGRDFTIEDGAINLNLIFSSGGEKKITGDLFFSDADGNLEPIPVEQTLVVNNRTDFFIEIPRMNVLYRGLPNEIRVIDPEIQQSNMTLRSGSADIIRGSSSTFEIIPKSNVKSVKVTVGDRSNTRVKKEKTFRVKDLPEMESSLLYSNNFFTSSTGISKRGLQRGRLTAKIPDDFDYELTIEVVSFTFQIGNSAPREIKGDKLNELFAVIEAQPKGARAFFDNVISRAYFNSGGKRRYVENVKVKDFNIKLR